MTQKKLQKDSILNQYDLDGDNTITDDGTLTITATTGITLGQDTVLSTGKDLETSTKGKIKQKGSFMQHSTNQAWVLGG